ncbi:2-hydroxyacid dehydrogenase [Pseudomaricurvus sp. HS19]|uniref:2-hydroxyacid dehydrogenase n=1 Tax=Pseudomaricurvus sp. HS19 TaxID=2692626 RepID=UPI001928C490|nr:2-hydroxyacid dehydrogenase [Pseudomaricurvus sp. HS19]
MIRIAFYDCKPYDRISFNQANKRFGLHISWLETHLNADTVSLSQGHQVVCAFVNDTIDAEVIHQLKQQGVRLLAMRCAGYNNVDLHAAGTDLTVVRVPGYSPYAVAEHAAALILTLNRHTHKAYNRTRDGNFSINGLLGFDLHGKVAGVIGTGQIGQCLISILNGFGMQVLAYDPQQNSELAARLGFTYTTLAELYRQSDLISLHCPLTPETFHLIDNNAIAQMKAGVMIINTGRGKLIDTKALITALKADRIGSAGLDVYEEEADYFFEDRSLNPITDDTLARLLTFPNVLITSHQGFFTREALHNIAETTLQNIDDFFAGRQLTNQVCCL